MGAQGQQGSTNYGGSPPPNYFTNMTPEQRDLISRVSGGGMDQQFSTQAGGYNYGTPSYSFSAPQGEYPMWNFGGQNVAYNPATGDTQFVWPTSGNAGGGYNSGTPSYGPPPAYGDPGYNPASGGPQTGGGAPATKMVTNNPLIGPDGKPNFLGGNSSLNPQYYGQYMDKLPQNMPNGGDDIIDRYGAAPWVQNWNTGSQMLSGAGGTTNAFNEQWYLQQNPDVAAAVQSGAFPNALAHYNQYGKSEGRAANQGANPWQIGQGGQSYYQPYQMMSGRQGGYGIPPIGTGPFAFGNPYQQAAQGSNLNISDAYNNARWDQYQDLTNANPGSPGRGTLIGGKEYNFAPDRADTSTGNPFTGAQAQGNTSGWASSDTGPTANQFGGSFQVGGGNSVTGNAAAEAAAKMGPQFNYDQAKMYQRYLKKNAKNPQRGERMLASFGRRDAALPGLISEYESWLNQNQSTLGGKNFLRSMRRYEDPLYWGGDLSVVPAWQTPQQRMAANPSIWRTGGK